MCCPTTFNETLRFHPRCPFGPGVRLPCLIALYRDVVSDAPAGIHRIALTPDVFAGGKVQRLTLGSWPTPRAFKLWPATDQLFLGEGIETVLAAATRLHYRGAPMRPAWAAGSSGNIRTFPVLARSGSSRCWSITMPVASSAPTSVDRHGARRAAQ